MQLDLFNDREIAFSTVRDRLSEGDLAGADGALGDLERRYPDDRRVARLRSLLTDVDAALPAGTPSAEALIDAAARARKHSEPLAERLACALLCSAAQRVEEAGPRGAAASQSADQIYLAAGEPKEAARVLRSAASNAPRSGRLLGRLARVLGQLGQDDEARSAWLQAFLAAPQQAAAEAYDDRMLSGVLDLIDELDLPGDPDAWVAAVGTVTRDLPAPELALVLGDGSDADPRNPRSHVERSLEATPGEPGLLFYRALIEERENSDGSEAFLDARRRMRDLSPALFDRYIGRPLVRSGPRTAPRRSPARRS